MMYELAGSLPSPAPPPVWAHTIGGSGGAEIELLIVGVAIMVLGFSLRSSQMARAWVPWVVLGFGLALVAAAFVVPRATSNAGRSFARLDIRQPLDGADVPAGQPVPVIVEVANAPVARSPSSRSGGHLHLFVDGRLEQMPYGTELEVRLDPGRHTLVVEYVDNEHVSFEPRVTESVRVTAVKGSGGSAQGAPSSGEQAGSG